MLKDAYDISVGKLGYDPFTTEAILRSLGRIYGKLGRPQEGIPYMQADLESIQRTQGAETVKYANTLHELGILYEIAGELEEARATMEASLSIKKNQWSPGHDQITSVQVILAGICANLGDDSTAERLCLEALPYLQDLRRSSRFAATVRVQNQIRQKAGDDAGAAQILTESKTNLSALGIDDTQVESMLTQ